MLRSLTCVAVATLLTAPALADAVKELPVTTKSKEALAAFLAAREAAETMHATEAEAGLKKAVALDADFAQALATLAGYLPSKEAAATAERAVALAKALPEAERLFVDTQVAGILGDPGKAIAAEKRLGELLPDDFRVRAMLGNRAWGERRLDEALVHLKRAAELSPKAGMVWNSVGYVYLEQHKNDDAVAAFKKYAQVSPTDPNAHDSLGDALLKTGKHAEAEASFRRAIAADDKFALAWSGVALSKANRGDWPGALAAMQSHVDKQPRAIDKPWAMIDLAWWQAAAGKTADAEKSLATAEKLAGEQKLDNINASAVLNRAELANAAGRPADALKLVDDADARAAKGAMSPGSKRNMKLYSLAQRLRAQALLGAKDEAKKTAAAYEAAAKELPDDAARASGLHEVKGDLLAAAGDWKGAIAEYGQCEQWASMCLGRGIAAAEKLGDKAAAEAMRAKMRDHAGRDGGAIFARAQVKLLAAPAAPAPAK